jgi:CRISPR-associated protein (TIGR03986 family)
MTQLTTPYNFVPLSTKVFFPGWAKDSRQLSHDAPLQNGWCGNLRIRLTAETPLLVAGTQNGAERHPLKVMGKYAIPGSSVRGMLRNVLEIASFGKFGRAVNDRAMSIRDLSKSSPYLSMVNGKVEAGWLEIGTGNVDAFATVTLTAWEHEEKSKIDDFWNATAQKNGNTYALNKLVLNERTGKKEAWRIVRTGDVAGKKKEFRFLVESQEKPIAISRDLFQKFAAAHQHNPLWANKQGEPGDLQKRLMEGKRIPVFFIYDPKNKTRIKAFGLAYMFRVPYHSSLHNAIGSKDSSHHDQRRLDFCEALFGLIHDGEDEHPTSLRSRVGFGLALATQAKPHPDTKGIDVVLNEPKPSFYPAYMKGGQTLMSDRPQLAGWKRYPVRTQAAPQNTNVGIKGKTNDNIGSKLFPLQKGATFEGDITLHNLHPEELGGLLWALTWGQQANLRHSLGMGRPFGFGSLKIEVLQLDLRHNSDASQDKNLSCPKDQAAMTEAIRQLMQPFEQTMETAIGKWASSDQIRELQAMANPALGDRAAHQLRYMPLEDFRLVKGSKGHTAQTLKPFSVLAQNQR